MSTVCGGNCVWSFDGTIWTSVDHCVGQGCACTDIVEVPNNPGTYMTTDSRTTNDHELQGLVKNLVPTIVNGKNSFQLVDRILERTEELIKPPKPIVDRTSTKFKNASTSDPYVIPIDCVKPKPPQAPTSGASAVAGS